MRIPFESFESWWQNHGTCYFRIRDKEFAEKAFNAGFECGKLIDKAQETKYYTYKEVFGEDKWLPDWPGIENEEKS